MPEQDQEGKAWIPTRNFYESDPRSREIRGKCEIILQTVYKLRTKTDLTANIEADLYVQLEGMNGELIRLGIVPNMQEGRPLEDYQSSPVVAAEYLAGQLGVLTGLRIVSERQIMPILQEHNEIQNSTVPIVELDKQPRVSREFMTQGTMISFISTNFDINVEPENSSEN